MDLDPKCLLAMTAGFHGPLSQMQAVLNSGFLSAFLFFNMAFPECQLMMLSGSLYAGDRSFGGFLIETWPSDHLYSWHGPFNSSPPVLCLSCIDIPRVSSWSPNLRPPCLLSAQPLSSLCSVEWELLNQFESHYIVPFSLLKIYKPTKASQGPPLHAE